MPPRPFPFPLSVGTDICSIYRIRQLLVKDRNSGRRLCRKLLSQKEFDLYWSKIERSIKHRSNDGREHLKKSIKTKKRQLGLTGAKYNEMPSPEAVSIKEGTDEEPMRVTDVHILSMLYSTATEHPYPTSSPHFDHSSTRDLDRIAGFVAGRWAAKEAIIKAYHSRRLTFHDIAILPPSASPQISNTRPPVAVVISESGDWGDGQIVPLSISHDTGYAIATCMAYEPPGTVFETADDVKNALDPSQPSKGSRSIELETEAKKSRAEATRVAEKSPTRGGLTGFPFSSGSRKISLGDGLETEAKKPRAEAMRIAENNLIRGGLTGFPFSSGSRKISLGDGLETEAKKPRAEAMRIAENNLIRRGLTGLPFSSGSRKISLGNGLDESEDSPWDQRNTMTSLPSQSRQNDKDGVISRDETTRQNKGGLTSASTTDSTMVVGDPHAGSLDWNARKLANAKSLYRRAQWFKRVSMRRLLLMTSRYEEAPPSIRYCQPEQLGEDPFDKITEYVDTLRKKSGLDETQSLRIIGERLSSLSTLYFELLICYNKHLNMLDTELFKTAELELNDIPAKEFERYLDHEKAISEGLRKDVLLAAKFWQIEKNALPIRFYYDLPQHCTEDDLMSRWDQDDTFQKHPEVRSRIYRTSGSENDLSTGVLIFKPRFARRQVSSDIHMFRHDLACARRYVAIHFIGNKPTRQQRYPYVLSEKQIRMRAAVNWVQHQRELHAFKTNDTTSTYDASWTPQNGAKFESTGAGSEGEATSPAQSVSGGGSRTESRGWGSWIWGSRK